MQQFSELEFKWVIGHNIINSQKISIIAQYSENAAQHINNSKSTMWFTEVAEAYGALQGKIIGSVWDFGTHGHGKGKLQRIGHP